ncbi:NAD-dependent epimerase/dehydratase family protein [Sphingobacterium bovistauri]|uniref:NAD-dependent epimerase/dehydratase family protein n=1 Tax=Sphingobacterium bovistauri TaxID=2781959 RepID=A0ABS7Z8X7_9SPHI|nr:NAD-dependent epimerase/dehydratase family protein [Sphingobacterium bovistauri]MCA5005409.1 NAD-dependent epimerase/dehydratase family protein [Sphingobacterium bovistauri]
MPETNYKALVLGSSGLIGNQTINLLLNNNKYESVYTISRTELPIRHSKLIQIIADYDSIEKHIDHLKIDHFYSCVGTTASKTPDKSKYYQIDLEYPKKVAQILKGNGCESISIVSSIGANNTSSNFYLKLKGDVEDAIKNTNLSSIHIFRPSLLLGERKEFRLMERISQIIYPIINLFLIGKLKDYKSIHAKQVASAMINVSLSQTKGIDIYQTQKIKELA